MNHYNEHYEKYYKCKKQFYKYIKQQLKLSVNPSQGNDFNFLIIPKNHPNEGKLVPIDYLLKNLIIYFWKHKYITLGVDVGYYDHITFITFDIKMLDGTNTIFHLKNLLKTLTNKKNIVIIDNHNKIYKKDTIKKYLNKLNKKIDEYILLNKNIILINYQPNFIGIFFNRYLISYIHNRLKINMPSKYYALDGDLIQYK